MTIRITVTASPPIMFVDKRLATYIQQGLQRAAAGARTEIVREVRRELPSFRAGDVRSVIDVVRRNDLSIDIVVREAPISP